MRQESDFCCSAILLAGAFLFSGIYLAAFHFYPQAASFAFYCTASLFLLGFVKFLHYAAPGVRVISWLHAMAFEGFAFVFMLCLRPFAYFRRGRACGRIFGGKPILLVHGYLHDRSAWFFLKREWEQAGLGPIYDLNLAHPFRSIRDYARSIAIKASEIARETKRDDLVLIGHSMGGLVCSWYAVKEAPPGKPLEVITIGSPLGGTLAAEIAIGSNGREMRRGSAFIQELQQTIAKNSCIPFFHIASMTDQLILPNSSGLTGAHPEREYKIDDLGHLGLLFSSRVAKKIETWVH